MSETCQCPVAGYCSRFNRVMGPRAHSICRSDVLTPEKCAAYRANWARLADPADSPIKRPPPKAKENPQMPAEIVAAAEQAAEARGILAGDLIAQMTTAIGIPPCKRCKIWQGYINRGHAWLRDWLQNSSTIEPERTDP